MSNEAVILDDATGRVAAHAEARASSIDIRGPRYAWLGKHAFDLRAKWASLVLLFWTFFVPNVIFGARTILTGDTTVYVNQTSGNDGNDGLTSGTAKATWQAAVNLVADTYDLAGFNVTIQDAAGQTDTAGILIYNFYGRGNVILDGGGSTIHTTGTSCIASMGGPIPQVITIKNIQLQTSGSAGSWTWGILVQTPAYFVVGSGVTFLSCAAPHMAAASPGAIIQIAANYTIAGSAPMHVEAACSGMVIGNGSARTVTLTGTPNFSSAFAVTYQNGNINLPSFTFSGAATGPRYLSAVLGSIYGSGTASATYFPGNSAGSTSDGGVYK